MFFRFPEDARWDADIQAVEFGIGCRRILRRGPSAVPGLPALYRWRDDTERCLEAFHLQRTRFELIVERKPQNRQLTEDGNVEINGRNMRALSRTATSATHTPHFVEP